MRRLRTTWVVILVMAVLIAALGWGVKCTQCGQDIENTEWMFTYTTPTSKSIYKSTSSKTPRQWEVFFKDVCYCWKTPSCNGKEYEAGKQTKLFQSAKEGTYEWGDGANVPATPYTHNKKKFTATVVGENVIIPE